MGVNTDLKAVFLSAGIDLVETCSAQPPPEYYMRTMGIPNWEAELLHDVKHRRIEIYETGSRTPSFMCDLCGAGLIFLPSGYYSQKPHLIEEEPW